MKINLKYKSDLKEPLCYILLEINFIVRSFVQVVQVREYRTINGVTISPYCITIYNLNLLYFYQLSAPTRQTKR